MTGILNLRNGSRLTAVFLYFFISHASAKGESTILQENISENIPQYFESYSDESNAMPETITDTGLLHPFEIHRNTLTIDGRSSSSRLPSKRREVVPEGSPVHAEGRSQSFLKFTPQTYSYWQDTQSGIREADERLADKRFTLNGLKRSSKKVANDYLHSSERKTVKLLLNKAPLGGIQLNKRQSSRNWAFKRWWGGYYRPRPQMDRRASRSKHYNCLRQCIGAGKLHPIQCHTLC